MNHEELKAKIKEKLDILANKVEADNAKLRYALEMSGIDHEVEEWWKKVRFTIESEGKDFVRGFDAGIKGQDFAVVEVIGADGSERAGFEFGVLCRATIISIILGIIGDKLPDSVLKAVGLKE